MKESHTTDRTPCSKCGVNYCPECFKECPDCNTPNGVPTEDESVKAYQEDIKAGVDVSGHETKELVV
jgi:hypothetical protein